MKLIHSKQKFVNFIWCPHPVTLDKSADWGEGNIQNFPNGVFLKTDENGIISHGVQPNESLKAPVGWQLSLNTINHDRFDKLSIFIDETIHKNGEILNLDTLDGKMEYVIKEDSVIAFQNKDGKPNMKDCWVLKVTDLLSNYEYKIKDE